MLINELTNNITILIPEIFLIISIVILLVYGVIYSKLGGIVNIMRQISILGIIVLCITLLLLWDIKDIIINEKVLNSSILGIDNLSIMVKSVVIITTILILSMSLEVFKQKNEQIKDYEYTILILLATLGMLLLISSKDLIIMYLSIETLSLSLYILAGFKKTGQLSTEAGLKYLIMGGLSSGILLFGCALIYISTGILDFDNLANYIFNNTIINTNTNNEIGVEIGSLLICIAIMFKLAAAPFHMWAPDVYEGSPTIITAFFAIVPKIAILTLLVNLIYNVFWGIFNSVLLPFFIFSALLSVIIGSIGAVNQTKFKRLLAYSAISHMGFILLGLIPGTLNSLQTSFIYIILYIITSLNTFAFTFIYFNKYKNSFKNTTYYLSDLSALSRKEPVLALTLTLSLFSIAGIPPLAGFISKYYILLSLIQNNYIVIATLTILFSVIACFYYIRIIQYMYFKNNNTYLIKFLADVVYRKVPSSYINNHNNINSNNNTSSSIYYNVSLSPILILGSTLYILISFIFYPNPLLMITFDAILNTFI